MPQPAVEAAGPAGPAKLHLVLEQASAPAAAPPTGWTDGLDAVGEFVVRVGWPVLVAIVLWRLFPAINAIVRSRAFTLEVAGMKLSVEDATEQLRTQIADLQQQVIKLREGSAPAAPAAPPNAPTTPAAPPSAAPSAAVPPPRTLTPRILWVDDKPSNNAYQIAQLERDGVKVVQSPSTEDALGILKENPAFHAVISDMGRREQGRYDGHAGLALLRRMRSEGHATPFMVYTTERWANRTRSDVIEAGGQGATASPVELLEWIRAQFR